MVFIMLSFFSPFAICAAPEENNDLYNSVGHEFIGAYDIDRLNAILTTEYAEFSSFEVSYPEAKTAVDLYRVFYSTVIPEENNRSVRVSGLVAVPQNHAAETPVVSYQHGTVFSKDEVPSNPEKSMETRLAIACFAAQGYIVIAADYVGKGVSDNPDGYLVKEVTAQTCTDMLFAAQTVLNQQRVNTGGELFLSGWSQGAFSTLVFLNRLEQMGVPVKAAALASAPSDLYLSINRWINVQTELDVQWLLGAVALLVHSYENYYNIQGLSDAAFRAEYRQTAKDLYENKITWEEAAKVFPATTRDLLEPSFIESGNIVGNLFFKKLQGNLPYNWRFKTPTQFYYGAADEVITPYVATLPVGYQKTMGVENSSAVFAGDNANHRGAFAFGLKAQQEWFNKLMSAAESE